MFERGDAVFLVETEFRQFKKIESGQPGVLLRTGSPLSATSWRGPPGIFWEVKVATDDTIFIIHEMEIVKHCNSSLAFEDGAYTEALVQQYNLVVIE